MDGKHWSDYCCFVLQAVFFSFCCKMCELRMKSSALFSDIMKIIDLSFLRRLLFLRDCEPSFLQTIECVNHENSHIFIWTLGSIAMKSHLNRWCYGSSTGISIILSNGFSFATFPVHMTSFKCHNGCIFISNSYKR